MKQSITITIVLVVVLVFAIIDRFVAKLDDNINALPRPTSELTRFADAEFLHASIQATDSAGKQRFLTQASSLLHYTDNSYEIVNALVQANQDIGAPLVLRAERAILMNHNKQAILQGVVSVDRQASTDAPAAQITSSDVSIDFVKKYAHSDAFTTIKSHSQVTSGTGIEIWFDGPTRTRLLSNARSSYIP